MRRRFSLRVTVYECFVQECLQEKYKCLKISCFFGAPGIKTIFSKQSFNQNLAFILGFLSSFMIFYVRPIFLAVMIFQSTLWKCTFHVNWSVSHSIWTVYIWNLIGLTEFWTRNIFVPKHFSLRVMVSERFSSYAPNRRGFIEFINLHHWELTGRNIIEDGCRDSNT